MKKIIVLAIAAFTLCFTSCKSKSNKISFALDWTPNTNHTGLYVAQANGYFAEEGLEVEIVQPSEDGATMMVASGRCQFGVGFQDSLAKVIASKDDFPIMSVAALLAHNTSGIISLKKTGIDSPKKLEGKNYATWESPTELATVRTIMEEDGADFGKLNLIPSDVYDIVTALNSGIDAVWIYYAWDGIKLELSGYETNYLDFAKLNPALDYYTPLFISNKNFLNAQPKTAKKFLKALRRGYEFAMENPEAAAEILCNAVPELDKELVYASQKWIGQYYKDADKPWGWFEAERWNKHFEWLNGRKVLDFEIDLNKGFTNEYLN